MSEPFCSYYGHSWSQWGLWQPEPLGPISPRPASPGHVPEPHKLLKQRARQCGRCGLVEWQDGEGRVQAEPFF